MCNQDLDCAVQLLKTLKGSSYEDIDTVMDQLNILDKNHEIDPEIFSEISDYAGKIKESLNRDMPSKAIGFWNQLKKKLVFYLEQLIKTQKRNNKEKNRIFVVYGRNHKLRDSMYVFLDSIGINPIKWEDAKTLAQNEYGNAKPYIGQVMKTGMKISNIILVIMSPDDNVKLNPKYMKENENNKEEQWMGQSRANVLYEMGFAEALKPKETIFIKIGDQKLPSDIDGKLFFELDNSVKTRKRLTDELINLGCDIDLKRKSKWKNVGDFSV
ncbi:MAG: hypothetical protein GF364_00235 [Candidatus Lokiarchaeota archaeon]|nr:hypothetical protein [Candidatus Lokiarchaeota archaeon]